MEGPRVRGVTAGVTGIGTVGWHSGRGRLSTRSRCIGLWGSLMVAPTGCGAEGDRIRHRPAATSRLRRAGRRVCLAITQRDSEILSELQSATTCKVQSVDYFFSVYQEPNFYLRSKYAFNIYPARRLSCGCHGQTPRHDQVHRSQQQACRTRIRGRPQHHPTAFPCSAYCWDLFT